MPYVANDYSFFPDWNARPSLRRDGIQMMNREASQTQRRTTMPDTGGSRPGYKIFPAYHVHARVASSMKQRPANCGRSASVHRCIGASVPRCILFEAAAPTRETLGNKPTSKRLRLPGGGPTWCGTRRPLERPPVPPSVERPSLPARTGGQRPSPRRTPRRAPQHTTEATCGLKPQHVPASERRTTHSASLTLP